MAKGPGGAQKAPSIDGGLEQMGHGDFDGECQGVKCQELCIWVWVKIRYPNNWMVNTKLD